MTTYEIQIERAAVRHLRNIDRQAQRLVDTAIQALADEPLPQGVKALTGPLSGLFRLRVGAPGGEYRVLYTVDHKAQMVTVKDVGSRENIY